MGPSTFVFMLRWHFIPFILGVSLVVLSIYGLLTFQGDAPDAAFASLAGMFGRPVAWCGVVVGLCTVGYAWFKASLLRNGA